MKRNLPKDASSESVSKTPRMEEEDVLQTMQESLTMLNDLDQEVKTQLEESQKHYFTNYMEKLLDGMPLGQEVLAGAKKCGMESNFLYMFTASKLIIATHLNVKKHETLNAISQTVAFCATKFVHNKFVRPMLKPLVSEDQIDQPLSVYSTAVAKEGNKSEVELQCLLQTIQETLDGEDQVIKMTSPLKAQWEKQLKAVGEYAIQILMTLSKPLEKPPRVLYQGKAASQSSS